MDLCERCSCYCVLVEKLKNLFRLETEVFLNDGLNFIIINGRGGVLEDFEDFGEFPWHDLVKIA